jgi:hypothetical protein
MSTELKVGSRVPVVITLLSAGRPGDTGTIVLATHFAEGQARGITKM